MRGSTELLRELRDLACDINATEIIDHVHVTRIGWVLESQWLDSWHNEFDRIVDELNSRAERTCEIIEYPDAPFPVCSECGAVQPEDYVVYYCWYCGARVSNDGLAPENGVRTDAGAVITGKRHHVIGGSE